MGDFDLSLSSLLLLLFLIFSSFLASFAAAFASFSAAFAVLASISFLIFSISFLLLPPSLICPSLSYPLPVIFAFLNLVPELCLELELSAIEGAMFEKGMVGRGEGDGVTSEYCSMLEPADRWFLNFGDERDSG
jgi:hypothetical protein